MPVGSRRAAGLSIALIVAAGASAAQVVVLSARGPSAGSFPAGAVLPAQRVLNLKPGDHLELLDSAGSRVVNGPGPVVAGKTDAETRARLIEIFLKGQQARPGLAATRGFSLRPESLWQADISEGGNLCVLKGQKPSFTVSDGGGAVPREIKRVGSGETRTVEWSSRAMSAQWPADLPVANGERYQVIFTDGVGSDLTWHTLDSAPSGLEPLAAALLQNGCYAQLERLREAADPGS